MKYEILDWAGNRPFEGQTFETFEDAWDYISSYLDSLNLSEDEFEENMGEYFVEERG